MNGSGLEKLRYLSEIPLQDFPKQWIPKFELYYPDLPQFPIIYVHILNDHKRIYGFPISIHFDLRDEKGCRAKILFLCNVNLEEDEESKQNIKNELEERFGIKDKLCIEDIMDCCGGNKSYEIFFKDLWSHVSRAYGPHIPYGKFYEEIFSIVRFVAAWQPKTGRQSEMRMLYNFLSIFGEDIEITEEWKHLEFYLIPTYKDVLGMSFDDFPKFKKLYSAMEKIWDIYFINEVKIGNSTVKSMEKCWPIAKDKFIEEVTLPLSKENKISDTEKHDLDRLVDAFNRHSWRAAFFIWNILNIKSNDYSKWNKDYFIKFYTNRKKKVGYSEKVVACFIQQGFKNPDAIPIDTWIETFHKFPLAVEDKKDFFDQFTDLGKLERLMWICSQANKTNMRMFFNLLWCQRYGDTGNNEFRRPNPIACYGCLLMDTCVGFAKIRNQKVLIYDDRNAELKKVSKRRILDSQTITSMAKESGCSFICLTNNSVPKKIFICTNEKNNIWTLIDEFSGYLLKNQKTDKVGKVVTVEGLLGSLPPFFE